jgi:hypothetical protein
MERLTTLAAFKAHLGITTPPGHVDDPLLQQKLDAAQQVILTYVGRTAAGATVVAAWLNPTTTPADVQEYTLFQGAEFWRFRGDDDTGPRRWDDADLHPIVLGGLRRYGGPVLQ